MVSVERKAYKRTIVSAKKKQRKNISPKMHHSEKPKRSHSHPHATPSNLVMNIIAIKREETYDL
jgi:hypothetical protein